ncbi:alpha/beta hydrolase [Spirillospora sp. NPDC050679]
MKQFLAWVTALIAAVFLLPAPAHADPAPPSFEDGFGLTQVGAPTGTATDVLLKVTTPEVAGERHIRVILPPDYASQPDKRYPVLYMLHGSPDSPACFTPANVPSLKALTSAIVVVPDGGKRGWYSNWVRQDTAAGAQNWKNFHIDQVIPFIDANLRTKATKQGRAIAGWSTGGFGALRYVAQRPDLFSQVASFSGILDLELFTSRVVLQATATNAGGVILPGSGSGLGSSCLDDDQSFGPNVPDVSIVGPLFDFWGNPPANIKAINPANNMRKTEGVFVSLYTGGNVATVQSEAIAVPSAANAKASLDYLKYPYYYKNYGNGSGLGDGSCNGSHTITCLNLALADYFPRLTQAFAQP